MFYKNYIEKNVFFKKNNKSCDFAFFSFNFMIGSHKFLSRILEDVCNATQRKKDTIVTNY